MGNSKHKVSAWIKTGTVFATHQIVATEGVVWLTILGSFLLQGAIREVHEEWAHSAFARAVHLILSNTPFFPAQIAAGGYLGWKVFSRWQHRSMFWVWILPGALLTYAVSLFFMANPWTLSAAGAIMSHFFGWGCQADYHCYDQLFYTQLFYASVAYSLGAAWASRKFKPRVA